jgi:histone-lysine N-methyltransferase SUV39H
VHLPDLAHIDSLKHLISVPGRASRSSNGEQKYVAESRHASLFLAYLQEQDESNVELTLCNDVDYEPCPPWDFAYTNTPVPSEETQYIDEQRKANGWPAKQIDGELKQGAIRGCSCGDGDDGVEVCNPATCACQKRLEEVDTWYSESEEGKASRGLFQYTHDGRLRMAHVYLHLCIFECTKACGCSDDCPNRVVQKGRTVPLEVFKTKSCGWGLRSRKALKAGTFITTYAGELITNAETDKRTRVYERHLETTYIFDIEPHMADVFANRPAMAKDLGVDLSSLTEDQIENYMTEWQARFERLDSYYSIDAGPWGNVSRFLNHSCDPNCGTYYVWIDEEFDVRRPIMCFFTRRDVAEGEELTFQYDAEEGPSAEEAEAAKDIMDREQSDVVTLTDQDGKGKLYLKKCYCGAVNCRRFMWTKPKDEQPSGAGTGTASEFVRRATEGQAGGTGAGTGAGVGEAKQTMQGRRGSSSLPAAGREGSQVASTPYRSRGKVPKLTPSHSGRPEDYRSLIVIKDDEEMGLGGIAKREQADGEEGRGQEDVVMRDGTEVGGSFNTANIRSVDLTGTSMSPPSQIPRNAAMGFGGAAPHSSPARQGGA